MNKWCLILLWLNLAAGLVGASDSKSALQPHAVATGPTPYLSPDEEAKKIFLPDGYRLELVLSDPIIRDPVVTVFDGNGRMFVAEMRSYMQDIDGKNEQATNGRISVHWSSKHDGVYDRHAIFADGLVLPRMILPVNGGLLVNMTDTDDIWLYRDTKGDGVADFKQLVYAGGKRGGNLEHQQSGLIWDRDNWVYQAVNAFRLRLQGTNMTKETTPANSGQWGLSQDDYGKLWFVNAGGELGPVNFQEPIIYGSFAAQDEPSAKFMEVWPLIGLADVEGGEHRFRPQDQTLNHFTACCGPDIFRGDRLPPELRGDLFFGEPVGRLIRRGRIVEKEGLTHLINPYEHSEFIRSTDPNFRPINMVTAPDGTLYIVDMYRGIIQEGNWVREGTYLRKVVKKYDLDKNFGRGRIWRLRYKDMKLGPEPHLLNETSQQLAKDLAHPNGWWRDTAQKLIVSRGDRTVWPALMTMARENKNPLARINALWTLEGLGELSAEFVREKFADPDPKVRVAAIRTSETLFKKGDKSFIGSVSAMAVDPNPDVAIQVMLTADLLKWPKAKDLISFTMQVNQAEGVQEIGRQLLRPGEYFRREFTDAQKKTLEHGAAIYNELCFVCHGPKGRGMALQGGPPDAMMAPPLADSTTVNGLRERILNVVLKGFTGPLNGQVYSAQMVPMESNNDDWIAAVVSYVRTSFGNTGSLVTPVEVAEVREASKLRKTQWTSADLDSVVPHPLTNRAAWKVTASHNEKAARLAIDGDPGTRYDTATTQVPGMWYQIQLPSQETVSGLLLDAGASCRDYPRGYEVQLSDDGKTWGKPVATGKGRNASTEIFFPPAKATFIRITQTSTVPGLFWSIHELQVCQPGAKVVATEAAQSKFE